MYWLFNEEIIDATLESNEYSMITITNSVANYEDRTQISTLKITSVEHHQFGWYKCFVNNTIGSTVYEVYLMLASNYYYFSFK